MRRAWWRGAGAYPECRIDGGNDAGAVAGDVFRHQSLREQLQSGAGRGVAGAGVTVTVLAPGYVETDFAARADLDNTPLTRSGQSPEAVARVGYDAMMDGRLHVVNEGMLSVLTNWVIPLLPRRQVLKMVRKMQTK